MKQRFTVTHDEDQSCVHNPEGNLVLRVSIFDPTESDFSQGVYHLKREWFDWLSTEKYETKRSKVYKDHDEARKVIKNMADNYSQIRERLVKKPSNDMHGYWIRESQEPKRVYSRVYALPDAEGFSLFSLDLLGKSMLDFIIERNPREIGKTATKKEADILLRDAIDRKYLCLAMPDVF